MAERTIDIIYRFMADTKQFSRELDKAASTNTEQLEKLQPPSYAQLEKEIGNATREISRLVKTGQLLPQQGKDLKNELSKARKELKQLIDLQAQYIREHKEFVALQNRPVPRATTRPKGLASEMNIPEPERFETGPDVFSARRSNRDEALAAYNRGHANSRDIQMLFGHSAGIRQEFEKIGVKIKVARVELSRFNREAQVEGKKSRATLEEIGRAVMVKGFSFYGLRMTGASIGQQGQLMSMIGGGVAGGIFKAAGDYIKGLESATETSREWATQMQRIEGSQKRIGAVLASESLPLLEKGADLLGKLANFLEKNPEAAGNAMKAGLTLAGVGALVIALGKGITLVSDIAFIAATINMLKGGRDSIIAAGSFMASSRNNVQAGTMMLAASRNMGKLTIGKFAPLNKLSPTITNAKPAVPVPTAAGGSTLASIATVVIPIAVGAAAGYLTDKVFDKIEGRDAKFEDYMTSLKQLLAVDAKALGDMLGGKGGMGGFDPFGIRKMLNIPEDLGDQWFKAVRDALFKVDEDSHGAADGLEGISDALKNSLKRDEILAAWEDYIADDLELARKHAADRKKIEADAVESIRKANQDFARDMQKIAANMNSQLAKARADFASSEEKEERQYQERRADLIREAAEQQSEMWEDYQEKLRKAQEEHLERRAEFLASRDAVGLVKEKKRYAKERAEIEREFDRETSERARESTRRLEELRVQHEQERAERFAEYQARLVEIRENARQEIAELQRKHAEELREIQLNRNDRLRELDLQHREERERRRNAFLAQVRELDAALLGEENLRKQYNLRMLKELDAFLLRYQKGMGSLLETTASIAGSRQSGGYVTQGLYRLHSGEYVINPSTTKTLEGLMGQQLTQSGLVQMAHNTRTQVTWNDQRRFDSRLQPSDRRAIRNDTLQILEKVVAR